MLCLLHFFYIHKLFWGVQGKSGIRGHLLNPVMFKYRQYGTQTAVIKKYTQVKEQESDVQLYVKDIKPKQNRARHPHESRGTDQLPAASIKEGKKKNCFLYCTLQKLARSAWKSGATSTNWPNTSEP